MRILPIEIWLKRRAASGMTDRSASGSPKRITNRDAICGRPVAAELEEISHVVNINLWPDKNSALNEDGKSRAQVCLEMPRACNKGIGRASERIALLRIVKAQARPAYPYLKLRYHYLVQQWFPDSVEIIKLWPVIQPRIGALGKSSIIFGPKTNRRPKHETAAKPAKRSGHGRRRKQIAVTEGIDKLVVGFVGGGPYIEINIAALRLSRLYRTEYQHNEQQEHEHFRIGHGRSSPSDTR